MVFISINSYNNIFKEKYKKYITAIKNCRIKYKNILNYCCFSTKTKFIINLIIIIYSLY